MAILEQEEKGAVASELLKYRNRKTGKVDDKDFPTFLMAVLLAVYESRNDHPFKNFDGLHNLGLAGYLLFQYSGYTEADWSQLLKCASAQFLQDESVIRRSLEVMFKDAGYTDADWTRFFMSATAPVPISQPTISRGLKWFRNTFIPKYFGA